MANIRIKDLPSDGAPKQTDLIPIDLSSTRHATVKAVVESGRPTASKTEAELGVEASKAMTPLTTKQAIDAQVGASYVPKTVKVNAGDGLTGGGELSGDVTVGLSAVSNASLAKADSAVQSVNGKSGNSITLAKADVGLGNVDNTSDINKPISTATQIALDGKYDNPSGTTSQYIRGDGSLSAFPAIPQGTVTSVGLTVPTGFSASGSPVTSSGTIAVSYAAGYQGYTSAEASKLAGIAAGAQVNTVNSVNTKTGAVVLNSSDVGAAPDTVVSDVNANTAARHTHSNKVILDATTASFLDAEKTKLSGIEVGAQVNTVTSVSGKTGAVTLVKGDVGLGNVDNTSDASKPVSTATQTALNAKANSSVTVSAGSGLAGGGNLTANRSIALNAASIASLGKADTALQAPGGSAGQILAKASADDNDVSWVTSEAATSVSYGPQTLTEAQKTQARGNIDAATAAQGGKADTALQTLTAGTNITISGTGTSRTINATVPPAPVTSVNSKTGAVVLNADDVSAVSYDPQTLTPEQQAQARENINAAGKRASREKWLLSSDWQAIPEDPAQVAYQRNAMTAITTQHPHIDFAFYPGDVVDRASNNGDGTAPSYGYPEFRADVESRMNIPWERWQFLPGNHDRDGTGLGAFKEAWSYMTYRKYMGPEYYTVRKGNVAHIFIGDMAGSNSGEIFPYVLEWLEKELNRLDGYNVFCWFHQPLHGVHPSSLTETSAWSQYEGSLGLRPILSKYADRIVFCGYGHVGVSTSSGTTFSTLDGIEWVNFSMAIPSMANGGWTEPGVYSIAEVSEDDNSIYVERWNLDAGTPLPAHSKSIPLKHPLNLGGSDWAFDGRTSVDPMNGVFTGPVSSYTSMADTRVLNDDTWETPPVITHAFKAYLGDDSNDSGTFDRGVGIGFYSPGTLTTVDDQGYNVTGWPSPYYIGGEIGILPTWGADELKQNRFLVRLSEQDGGLQDVFDAVPSDLSRFTRGGINVLNGGGVRIGDVDGLDNADSVGAQLHPNNYIKVSRPSFCGLFIRHTTPGSMLSFQYGQGTVVGNISVTATSTDYNTSSDKTLKDDKGKLSYEDALTVLELISIHNFDWKSTGESDIGVFAQDLYEIYPNAVSVGGWYCSDMDVPCDEDHETAVYKPWAVDYSKLMPVVIRVIQGLLK